MFSEIEVVIHESETCESDFECSTVIGPQNVYQPIRWKLGPIVTCSLTFPAFKSVDMYFLCFFSLAPRVLIGCCDYFDFGFTIFHRNCSI